MCKIRISFSNINIQIVSDFKINVSKRFQFFLTDNECVDYYIFLKKRNSLELIDNVNLNTDKDRAIEIFKNSDVYIQVIRKGVIGDKIANCYYQGNVLKIEYLENNVFLSLDNLFSTIGIENIMCYFDSFFIHASIINYFENGIVFMGPSGIGKSTRADLWKKYANAEIINGDKTLLKKIDNIWYGCGSSFAGSSNYYVNKMVKIKCIVLIKRGNDNQIELKRLQSIDAFKSLYVNTTIPLWNKSFQEMIIKSLEDIAKTCLIYQMICPPDQRCVDVLKGELKL